MKRVARRVGVRNALHFGAWETGKHPYNPHTTQKRLLNVNNIYKFNNISSPMSDKEGMPDTADLRDWLIENQRWEDIEVLFKRP